MDTVRYGNVVRASDSRAGPGDAGRQLSAWLTAVNSGDRATIQQFIDRSSPGRTVEQALTVYNRTGGFDVKKVSKRRRNGGAVEESSDTRIVVLAQERGAARRFVRISLTIQSDAPHQITGSSVQATPPPPEFAPPKLTAAERDASEDWRHVIVRALMAAARPVSTRR